MYFSAFDKMSVCSHEVVTIATNVYYFPRFGE